MDYFDKEDFVGCYIYFGVFCFDVFNVGKDIVFFNNVGEFMDMGLWYFGGSVIGVEL